MSRPRLAIFALIIALSGALVAWRHRLANNDEQAANARTEATEAMAALNKADADFATWLPSVTTSLASQFVLDFASAKHKIKAELLPKIDEYLATSNKALAAAGRYLALDKEVSKDTSIQSALVKIRQHTTSLNEARTTFVAIGNESDTPSPADLERISASLLAVATKMLMSN
jgi:hypothetical protein